MTRNLPPRLPSRSSIACPSESRPCTAITTSPPPRSCTSALTESPLIRARVTASVGSMLERLRKDLRPPDLALLELDHHPVPRPRHRVPASFLVKTGFFLFGVPEHSFCTIDVTNRCNIRCDHCYFF